MMTAKEYENIRNLLQSGSHYLNVLVVEEYSALLLINKLWIGTASAQTTSYSQLHALRRKYLLAITTPNRPQTSNLKPLFKLYEYKDAIQNSLSRNKYTVMNATCHRHQIIR